MGNAKRVSASIALLELDASPGCRLPIGTEHMEQPHDGSLRLGLTRALCLIIVALILAAAAYSAAIALRDFSRISV